MLATVCDKREKLEITSHYESKIIIHKMSDVTSKAKFTPIPTYQEQPCLGPQLLNCVILNAMLIPRVLVHRVQTLFTS